MKSVFAYGIILGWLVRIQIVRRFSEVLKNLHFITVLSMY
jgi:hypothetical protein